MSNAMNMSNYESDLDLMEAEYGDEIMCAGWNPDVDLVRQQLQLVPAREQMTMPIDLGIVISELFLRRMYSYRH